MRRSTLTRPILLAILCLTVSVTARSDSPAPFTEMESLRIENVRLEGVILQRQLTDWQTKRDKLAHDIESARPGFTWNPDTGVFTKRDLPK